jgi:hypothetical protein
MTPQDFVSCVRREVLEANLALYRQNLGRSVQSSAEPHTFWPKMTELYQSLTEEQRRQFVEGIRQVMVDTLSNVLGILDGSTLLEHHRGYFHLTYGDEPHELNGELQDLFLSQ